MFYPVSIPLSGDLRIDGLLEATSPTLAMSHALGTPVVVTYSFLEQEPAPGTWSRVHNEFRAFSQVQRDGVTSMLAEIAAVVGITFQHVDTGGVLRFGLDAGFTTVDGMLAKAYSSTDPFAADSATYVWLNHHVPEVARLDTGYGRQLVLHETAHSLGLKHPQHYGSSDSGPELPASMANARYTVMSYNGGMRNDLGELDILTLRYLYGEPGVSASRYNHIDVTEYPNDMLMVGSFFNDHIKLNASAFKDASPLIDSGAGDDLIQINLAGLQSKILPMIKGGAGLDSVRLDAALADVTLGKATDGLPTLYYQTVNGNALIFLNQIERIHFTDTTLALDVDVGPAQVFRLYQAAFDRTPDKGGLGYWIARYDAGMSLNEIGSEFIASREFSERYGSNTADALFIDTLYQNILDRSGDAEGVAYWLQEAQSGSRSRADILIGFSESPENYQNLISVIGQAIEYTHYPM